MLFDLRSRGRRRTVQVIYIGLAVLIGAGLILFGVGTGSGGGGLFGAFTGNGSSGNGNGVVNSQTKQALAATKKNPNSSAAWANLVTARFSAANSVGYDSTTGAYSAAGKRQLSLLTDAYQRYLALVKSPSTTTATLAAHAYSATGQYTKGATAYQAVLQSAPDDLRGIECVAILSYAAGNDNLGAIAEAHAVSKVPKDQRKELRTELELAKTSKASAASAC